MQASKRNYGRGLSCSGHVLPNETQRIALNKLIARRKLELEIERIEKEILHLHPLGSQEDEEQIQRANVIALDDKRKAVEGEII